MPTQPVATTMIPINNIHPNPTQPRKFFDPQAIEDLKASMDKRGLICPIAVVKSGESDFTIVAGERRYRAALELKWDQIDCRIWPSETTPQEVEMLSLVENIQRKDLNPIEIGNGYKQLTLEPFNMSQEDLADQCGQSRGTVSQYLMIGGLDPSVQEIANRLANLGLRHLLQICRLKTPEEQIAMAQETGQRELSVKELKALVDKKLSDFGNVPGTKKKRGTPLYQVPVVDPLANLWPDIHSAAMGTLWWDVKFGQHKLPTGDALNGWFFFAAPVDGVATKDALAAWFKEMTNSLTAEERILKTEKVDPLLETSASVSGLRSSDSDAPPLAELEELGKDGPGPIYAKLAPGSPLVEMMKDAKWSDFGAKDAKEGLPQLLAALKAGKEQGL